MNLTGTHDQIMTALTSDCPEAAGALKIARKRVKPGKQEIYPYQAAALYKLANRYDSAKCHILELGTYYGYSAAVMAQAAGRALIETLNPTSWEVDEAKEHLKDFGNVVVRCIHSWDFLAEFHNEWKYDLIFVDGDHKRVRLDLPWWNHLAVGGLFLFHDYTPLGSPRHCPPVYEVLNKFRDWLGRDFDVLVVDNEKVGMAGFYKQAGDPVWSVKNG